MGVALTRLKGRLVEVNVDRIAMMREGALLPRLGVACSEVILLPKAIVYRFCRPKLYQQRGWPPLIVFGRE